MNRDWNKTCTRWKEQWPVFEDSYLDDRNGINMYAILDLLNKETNHNHILMTDAGSGSYICPVALNLKADQRLISSPSQADMGWALPASIGVAIESRQCVIPIVGDGSFMTNIQELATVSYHDLNIKFIILNNNGYLSIKNTQSKYFNGRVYGAECESGFRIPDLKGVSSSFGINYQRIEKLSDGHLITEHLSHNKPVIIDVICLSEQEILPYQALKEGQQAGPHDMAPFLPENIIKEEAFIDLPYVASRY